MKRQNGPHGVYHKISGLYGSCTNGAAARPVSPARQTERDKTISCVLTANPADADTPDHKNRTLVFIMLSVFHQTYPFNIWAETRGQTVKIKIVAALNTTIRKPIFNSDCPWALQCNRPHYGLPSWFLTDKITCGVNGGRQATRENL